MPISLLLLSLLAQTPEPEPAHVPAPGGHVLPVGAVCDAPADATGPAIHLALDATGFLLPREYLERAVLDRHDALACAGELESCEGRAVAEPSEVTPGWVWPAVVGGVGAGLALGIVFGVFAAGAAR